MNPRKCRVCHESFNNYLGFRSHVASEYRRFERAFGRRAQNWQEIVDAFNGKPPVICLADFVVVA